VSARHPTFLTRPQHRLEFRKRQPLVLLLRLLRRRPAGHQKVAEVLRRSETSIMIGATVDDLALFRQVLAPGPQRVLDRAHRLIEDGAFPPTGRLRTRRSIAGTPASSASAMSVTVAPEARAFAISGQVALTS
jgi:hypothetical protein